MRHQLDSDTHCRKEELLIERQAIVGQLESACRKVRKQVSGLSCVFSLSRVHFNLLTVFHEFPSISLQGHQAI